MSDFFYQEGVPGPDDLTLAERLSAGGLLPGDDAWDPLLDPDSDFIAEWIGKIRIETEDDQIVLDHAIAQIRRLLPDTDVSDRSYVMVGMIVMQAWLYTWMSTRANLHMGGHIHPADEQTLRYMEYRLTTLVTLLEGMEDDTDMSTFESMIKETGD